ncbi:MAG: TlpA family protein disulfide reductase [Niastella sp.]|nr:TlpA family protein disulfide reductase [Niastella sp.]
MKQIIFSSLLLIGISATLHAQPKKGEKVPDIAIPDVEGKTVKLSSLKGKVVLIDFWASWCGPCRKAMPGLRNAYAAYKSKGFEIYGISLDERKPDWHKAITADKITWIQVNEPGGWESRTAKAWNIEQLPSSFLLDKEGKVIAIDPTEKELTALLQAQLP